MYHTGLVVQLSKHEVRMSKPVSRTLKRYATSQESKHVGGENNLCHFGYLQ